MPKICAICDREQAVCKVVKVSGVQKFRTLKSNLESNWTVNGIGTAKRLRAMERLNWRAASVRCWRKPLDLVSCANAIALTLFFRRRGL
jgi:hypothetical protein